MASKMSFRSCLRLWIQVTALFHLVVAEDPLSPENNSSAWSSSEIFYVVQPFESIDSTWSTVFYNDRGQLNLTSTTGLFDQALKVEYEVTQTENWGGFVSIEDFLDISEGAYTCQGATHLSFWYKILQPQSSSGTAHLRLILLDGSDCLEDGCNSENGMERYYSFHYILDDPASDEWKEVRIELRGDDSSESPFWRTGWAGQVGNNVLEPNDLVGWVLELSVNPEIGLGNSTSGSFLIDQMTCVGRGELLGAAFYQDLGFEDPLQRSGWSEETDSEISANRTVALLEDGKLSVNYTIEQTVTRSGYIAYDHIAPRSSYYNLSQAKGVLLNYAIDQAATIPQGTSLQIDLYQSGRATIGCSNQTCDSDSELDVYSTVQNILHGNNTSNLTISFLNFIGNTNNFENSELDVSSIKGFSFRLNLDSQVDVGFLVDGALTLSDLEAVVVVNDEGKGNETADNEVIVFEQDLTFDESSPSFNRIRFQGRVCTDLCKADPTCLYGFSNSVDCFLASSFLSADVGLAHSMMLQSTVSAFWVDDSERRGDLCERCECRAVDRTIDCRDQNLVTLPKTFPEGMTWTPRVLDLRQNDNLALIGSNSLEAIAPSLEEIFFPKNLAYLSFEAVGKLPSLATVHFENEEAALDVDTVISPTLARNGMEEEDLLVFNQVSNLVTGKFDFFGELCCKPGNSVDLLQPSGGLTFCEMQVENGGADAVYEPFIQHLDAPTFLVLQPSSANFAEAAESAEKCGTYCSIMDGCEYFAYDARVKNSEHICYLQSGQGTPQEVCCNPDDYADDDQTEPGWTSGRPPATRHRVDNARLTISGTGERQLTLREESLFTAQYTVALGLNPLRGAVWIEPTIVSETDLEVLITPRRIALYNNFTETTFTVEVTNTSTVAAGETLVLVNSVQSCDAAFVASTTLFDETSIYVEVLPPAVVEEENQNRLFLILVGSMGLMVIVGFLFMMNRRKMEDTIWKVKKSELTFGDPVEIIGQGSFGQVLLAEYRGTLVAVKTILPRRKVRQPGRLRDTINPSDFDPAVISSENFDSSQDDSGEPSQNDEENPAPQHNMNDLVQNEDGQLSNSEPSSRAHNVNASMARRSTLGRQSVASSFKSSKGNFAKEMRQLSKLRHPCITTVMGAVVERRLEPMLIMEYMDNGSLYDLLHNETLPLDGELVLPILRDITKGVRFLHSATPAVIHGDLKAQNILVDSKFRAKVADFGLSQKKNREGISGTPYWMAPELLRGEGQNTTASDVYSFGIILYEVYSRRDPYEGENYEDVVKQVADPSINKRPPTPESCPIQVHSLMNDSLAAQPEDRVTFVELDVRLGRLNVDSAEPVPDFSEVAKHREGQAMRTNELLYDVFPKHIAEALRDGRKVEPESRDEVTIFFSDIVGFTTISSTLPPIKVSDMLDRLYSRFDQLSEKHQIFKVETIGDAYMAVTNLIRDQSDHAKRIAMFAIEAVQAANETLVDPEDPDQGGINIRVGFHSGPVVASVVGSRNPRYCLFGDTVNVAARMESSSAKNRILCTDQAAKLVNQQCPEMKLKMRGKIDVKGKGLMLTYWVNERSSSGYRLNASKDRSVRRALRPAPSARFVGHSSQTLPSLRNLETQEVEC